MVDPREAVADAGVARHLPRHDLRVGILSLDDELHTLDRRRAALGDAPRGAAGNEVLDEVKRHRDQDSRAASNVVSVSLLTDL